MARRDVPTCALSDRMGEVRPRVTQANWDACVVVNAEHVVLGLIRGNELEAEPETRAEQVMEPAPKTYRPSASLQDAAGYMAQHHDRGVLVTDSDGRLMGLLRQEDVEWPQGGLPPVEKSAAGGASD